MKAGDRIVTGCKAWDCPFIDFEIAAQASFFMGTLASTISSVLIRDWREYRRVRASAHYFPTVIDCREKKASLSGKFALGPGGQSWRV